MAARIHRVARVALLALFTTGLGLISARGDVRVSLGAADLQTATPGVLLPGGTLIQFVDLGADGVFNPIVIDDGGNAWVSGDDALITASYSIGATPGDFSSAAAFDLRAGGDSTPGLLLRDFTFATGALAAGTKLGIRWFPGLTPENFYEGHLPAMGQAYGEFSRQGEPLYQGDAWVVPDDGVTVNFDPLETTSAGGSDADASAVARFSVIPEPATVVLLAMGLLAWPQRRRA